MSCDHNERPFLTVLRPAATAGRPLGRKRTKDLVGHLGCNPHWLAPNVEHGAGLALDPEESSPREEKRGGTWIRPWSCHPARPSYCSRLSVCVPLLRANRL